MKMKRSWITGAVAGAFMLVGLTSNASALDVDLGVLGVPSTTIQANNPPNVGLAPFVDNYNFQVATLANLDATATIFNFDFNGASLNIPLGSVTVALFENGAPVALATAFANMFHLAYSNLLPGINYRLQIQGVAFGSEGGLYSLVMDTSPVPLPAAAWLFVSALLGLVSFARLRRDRVGETEEG